MRLTKRTLLKWSTATFRNTPTALYGRSPDAGVAEAAADSKATKIAEAFC